MFENIAEGTEVVLHMAGSTQGIAMRALYEGTDEDGLHHLSGVGVMSDLTFTANDTHLSNGRALTRVTLYADLYA